LLNSRGLKIRAYFVHLFTAAGIIFAFLAAAETCTAGPDPRWVFFWLAIAVMIDVFDGPLARRWEIKNWALRISGRTIDDIVDYLTFTFIPLLLAWRMHWLTPPGGLWVVLAMGTSLFGFANTNAKQEQEGFFLGFPSYWNIYAYYAGILSAHGGALVSTIVLLLLSILTVVPVRFVYPNQAPKPWRSVLLVGGIIWAALLLSVLPGYPDIPAAVVWISFIYPLFYVILSIYLHLKSTS